MLTHLWPTLDPTVSVAEGSEAFGAPGHPRRPQSRRHGLATGPADELSLATRKLPRSRSPAKDRALTARVSGREPDELRPITFTRDYTEMAAGSVLVEFGRTRVLCTASVEDRIPPWLRGKGKGWVTAEYSMLPGSSPERVGREAAKGKQSGRTQEIQRLIGRSLRAVTDLVAVGENQIVVDCDVLQADGGTRTASICGGWIALHDACSRLLQRDLIARHPIREACAAISVGVIDGVPMLDLEYTEDVRAEVDMNVVMTAVEPLRRGAGHGRRAWRSRATSSSSLLALAESGIAEIVEAQEQMIAVAPTPRP